MIPKSLLKYWAYSKAAHNYSACIYAHTDDNAFDSHCRDVTLPYSASATACGPAQLALIYRLLCALLLGRRSLHPDERAAYAAMDDTERVLFDEALELEAKERGRSRGPNPKNDASAT